MNISTLIIVLIVAALILAAFLLGMLYAIFY